MPSLLDDLKADQDPRIGMCKFCVWLATRPVSEQREWAEAMADEAYTTASLIRQARKRGYEGGSSAPETHRKGKHGARPR